MRRTGTSLISIRNRVGRLSPADPAGAKPRRDHRFLDRVSRHEVPKTPGKDDAFKVYDPARVSHSPDNQCDALAGSRDRLQCLIPGSKKRAPLSGCFVPHSSQ